MLNFVKLFSFTYWKWKSLSDVNSLQPHGLYSPWNSPGQSTGVGSLSLLQGIFPAQGSNPGLPHCRWILYHLKHQGSLRILDWVAYLFSSGSSRPRNRTGVSCIAGTFFTNRPFRVAFNYWDGHMILLFHSIHVKFHINWFVESMFIYWEWVVSFFVFWLRDLHSSAREWKNPCPVAVEAQSPNHWAARELKLNVKNYPQIRWIVFLIQSPLFLNSLNP